MDENEDIEIENEIVNHVFLPKKLPGNADNIIQIETNLLNQFTKFLCEYSISDLEDVNSTVANTTTQSLDEMKKLFISWNSFQGVYMEVNEDGSDGAISEVISELTPGESFAFYVREQNAALHITYPKISAARPGRDVIISSFLTSQSNRTIFKSGGDLVAEFPATCVNVPFSKLLKSKEFASTLISFSSTSYSPALKKSQKARQEFDEARDVAHPMLITQYLSCTLTNDNSKNNTEFVRVMKKIRDEVRFENALKPFRRSGLWMSIKVILQLELVNRLGVEAGSFLYKLLLLSFMEKCCANWCFRQIKSSDLVLQMIAKISRRLAKLHHQLEKLKIPAVDELEIYYYFLQSKVESTVKNIRAEMNDEWENIIEEEESTIIPSITPIAKENYTKHRLQNSWPYLNGKNVISSSSNVIPAPPLRYRFRYAQETKIFPSEYFEQTSDEELLGLILYDFELFILNLPEDYFTKQNIKQFLELFEKYVITGRNYYSNDPVGKSRLVLTSLKCIQMFDILAISNYELLKDHDCGIDSNIIQDLLLPMKRDLVFAQKLESYFLSRNNASSFPSVIGKGQSSLTSESFSVRYATNNMEMEHLRELILADGERKCEEKVNEVRRARQHWKELVAEANLLSCEYRQNTSTDIHGIAHTSRDHSSDCRKCSLNSEADACTARKYEKPLPENECYQRGIVFELLVPLEIACLRDALYIFSEYVCEAGMIIRQKVQGCWTGYWQISQHFNGKYQKYVELVSTSELSLSTHYGSIPLHVKYSTSRFILNNGYNCWLGNSSGLLNFNKHGTRANIKNSCTFLVNSKSPYYNLQWTVNSTQHTQNQVLAQQVDCSTTLQLSEYNEFGSLRAGHRLQLRNIYKAFAHSTLSFREDSILSLLCQTIWEAGPPSSIAGGFYRESHQDFFTDKIFTLEMLNCLNTFLEKNEKNWSEQYLLLIVVLIANRIRSIASGNKVVETSSIRLIRKCRKISMSWVSAVEEVLSRPTEDMTAEQQAKLRVRVVEIGACGALTFVAESNAALRKLATTSTDLSLWLKFITIISDNVLLHGSGVGSLPPLTKNILRLVRTSGVHLESYFIRHKSHKESLGRFIMQHWSGTYGASLDELVHWTRCPSPSDQWLSLNYKPVNSSSIIVLQIDIVLGKLLVNGSSVARLPNIITNHGDFIRMFGTFVFVVDNYGDGVYMTKHPFHGCVFKFQLRSGDKQRLIITEIEKESGVEFELIPNYKLEGDIPCALLNNYSHWKEKSTQMIHFRSMEFLEPTFRSQIKFKLNLNARTLTEEMYQKSMVDINSNTYAAVSKVMARLEDSKHIHIFEDTNPNADSTLSIELPRMGLHFYLHKNGRIMSKEYRGYEITPCQGFGSLIGLQNYLIISQSNANSIILLPHGTPKAISGSRHQNVYIDYTTLRCPKFFAFEIDTILRRLKAQPSQSAWSYLAHLHALTSSPLPDPFTGLTGTESAMTILQSPFCWSCEPLDPETNTTLSQIENMAPFRSYFPAHMRDAEIMTCHSAISSTGAHDSFYFLVQKLKSDSNRSAFLFETSAVQLPQENPNKQELAKRGYWRNSAIYSPQAQISPEFDAEFSAVPNCTAVSSLDLPLSHSVITDYEADNIKSVRLLANLNFNKILPPNLHPKLLAQSLCDTTKIIGPGACPIENYLCGFDSWTSMNFVSNWLGLYNYARSMKSKELESSWTLMLCAFAYTLSTQFESQECLTEHLKLLQAVMYSSSQFKDLNPPNYDCFDDTSENYFNSTTISNALRRCAIQFKSSRRDLETKSDYGQRVKLERMAHNSTVDSQIADALEYLENVGLAFSVSLVSAFPSGLSHIKLDKASPMIKALVRKWYINRKLKLFIEAVEKKLTRLKAKRKISPHLSNTFNLSSDVDLEALQIFGNKPRFDTGKVWFRKMNQSIPSDSPQNTPNIIVNPFEGIAEFSQDTENARKTVSEFPLSFTNNNDDELNEILTVYKQDLKESWDHHINNNTKTLLNLLGGITNVTKLEKIKSNLMEQSSILWEKVLKLMQVQQTIPEMNVLVESGLFYRITPVTILPKLVDVNFNETLKIEIQRIAIMWTQLQKANRCIRYTKAGSSMELALNKELANHGYENWDPNRIPEWLLLQLEMDLMIRSVQVDVANKMGKSEGPHSLMQLNMGEGKTTVIIPMLAARLADGNQLARVTVLKSMYNTNKKMLAYSIGGLLNQRIYTFPCRRDMSFTNANLNTIQGLYEECLQKKGVVITVPEYQLSFQLKSYETCRTGQFDLGSHLVCINKWQREYIRDILDECDEILGVKYQLVYTIGEQLMVGGGNLRWTVAQQLLEILPKHLFALKHKWNTTSEQYIEAYYFKETDAEMRAFPHCRILKPEIYHELCINIATDILNKNSDIPIPEIPDPKKRMSLLKFLTEMEPGIEAHMDANEIFEDTTSTITSVKANLEIILILRGLLACGVLLLALTRRWRVNYGVNPSLYKRMAVPFRAKDVSSERTEFGHSDVAILLTQLSYYYSGLKDDEVRQCFEFLERYDDKEIQYRSWIQDLEVDQFISELKGVNLRDYGQMSTKTIPTLRKNTRAIDFWLSNAVYPKESKQFPQKMLCSAWDLCSDAMKLPVTGFSGTNDSKILLPLTINQEELPELMGTNGQVLHNVLLPENNYYKVFPPGTTGIKILQFINEGVQLQDGSWEDVRLLLDVGALMIDLDNQNVIKEWLALLRNSPTNKIQAGIYFNESDELRIIDHEHRDTSFQLSPYRTCLENCVIYLDDVHTRGTDLKIPHGTRGALTLGKGVTKDKLVQACMRMRMLGHGHKLAFYPSQEVDNEIRAILSSTAVAPGVTQVMLWVLRNSCIATRDGFQHWINAAANYYTKSAAHALFESSDGANADLERLGDSCCENEVLELKEIYGAFQTQVKLPEIAEHRMDFHRREFLRSLPSSCNDEQFITNIFLVGQRKMKDQCTKFVPSMKRLLHLLDEEQERELEQELEEERQKERPGPATPLQHNLAKKLKEFVANPNQSIGPCTWCAELPKAFANTHIWSLVQEDCWGQNIFATKDFCDVVVSTKDGVGEFLRPVTWILSRTYPDKNTILLLLSPFEANELLPMIQSYNHNNTKLHMFAPRLHPDHSTLWKIPQLCVPSGLKDTRIMIDKNIFNSNLLLFSGSIFFCDAQEQEYYCYLLGHAPNQRTAEEQSAFENGWIKHGFVSPEFRDKIGLRHGIQLHCLFKMNPEPLVQAIIKCRHSSNPPSSHVAKLMIESKKFDFDNQ